MPSKKKKYNARFPAGRIKKIMQTDEEVGKVAQAVPVIISRTLELFVQSLLTKSTQITQSRNAKTLTPSHMKQCILSESRFDFLKDLVKNIPDASVQEDNENNENNVVDVIDYSMNREEIKIELVDDELDVKPANFYTEQSTSTVERKPVIQYGPSVRKSDPPVEPSPIPSLASAEVPKINIKMEAIEKEEPNFQIDVNPQSDSKTTITNNSSIAKISPAEVPPLIPISQTYGQSTSDNLYIDEDYDI